MPDIIIPRGGPRDGWIWLNFNGVQQWIKAGEVTTVSDSITEILDHAHISYVVVSDGDLVAPEGFAFVVDGDGNYVVDGDGAYVVTEI